SAEVKVIAAVVGQVAPRCPHGAYRHIKSQIIFFETAVGLLNEQGAVAVPELVGLLSEDYLFRVGLGVPESSNENIHPPVMIHINESACEPRALAPDKTRVLEPLSIDIA